MIGRQIQMKMNKVTIIIKILIKKKFQKSPRNRLRQKLMQLLLMEIIMGTTGKQTRMMIESNSSFLL